LLYRIRRGGGRVEDDEVVARQLLDIHRAVVAVVTLRVFNAFPRGGGRRRASACRSENQGDDDGDARDHEPGNHCISPRLATAPPTIQSAAETMSLLYRPIASMPWLTVVT